ncbi:MAG: antibiotic biosynthesis monooxygenase [Pseudomonadota bacterium]
MMQRREFVGHAATALALAGTASPIIEGYRMEDMYGLIGQMKVAPDKRRDIIALLAGATRDMAGNIAYLIAEDLEDDSSIWITEVWQTKTDHANSLKLPSVQDAIAKARPHITGFGTRVETKPIARD